MERCNFLCDVEDSSKIPSSSALVVKANRLTVRLTMLGRFMDPSHEVKLSTILFSFLGKRRLNVERGVGGIE